MFVLNDSVINCIEGKASSIWLCNVNMHLETDIVRLLGAKVEVDKRHLTVFVPITNGAGIIHNFAASGKVTFLTAIIFTYESYQIKGRYISHRPCITAEIEYQKKYMNEFSDALAAVGLSKEKGFNAYYHEPSVAVRILAEEVFEQTPKKGAGEKLYSNN